MDEAISTYFAAWNEPDSDHRRRLLERSVTDDAELVDPTGRVRGIDRIAERIGRYQSAAAGTRVEPAGGVDAHNDVVRYAWTIVDAEDQEIMEGMDVAERGDDGRLKRILMFHGPLPAAGQ
jgi:SnoaL-like domain